jgi:membrane protein YqaA with SNARE-associated domain
MDIIGILFDLIEDPVSYSLIFFIYVVLAAVILPIPVEIGLFNPYINPALLIAILALGKGLGAFVVYHIGLRLRKGIKKRFKGGILTRKIVKYCEGFVKKYGYVGLFIIMSMPLMIDSASLYLFSLLNVKRKNGKRSMILSRFILINIGAGALRGSIVILISYYVGIRLV